MKKTDPDDVKRKISQIIDQAVINLYPKPTKSLAEDGTQRCFKRGGNKSYGRVSRTTVYWLDDVPAESGKQLLDQAYNAWKKHGHHVLEVPDHTLASPSTHFTSKPDNYRMSVIVSKQGRVSIGVSSTCYLPTKADPKE